MSSDSSPDTPKYATVPNLPPENNKYDVWPDAEPNPCPGALPPGHMYNHLYIKGQKIPDEDNVSQRSQNNNQYDDIVLDTANEYDTISNLNINLSEHFNLYPFDKRKTVPNIPMRKSERKKSVLADDSWITAKRK